MSLGRKYEKVKSPLCHRERGQRGGRSENQNQVEQNGEV